MFDNLSKTAKVMMVSVVAICCVLLVLGLLVIFFVHPFEAPLLFTTGIFLGCVHSAVKVALLEKSITALVDMEKDAAKATAKLHFFGRFLITLALFAVVIIFSDVFGLIGAAIGALSLQFSAYTTNIVLNRQEKREK